MFGINGGEFLVILLVAVIVVGPGRLPHYAEQLARLTKQAHQFVQDARRKVDEELGDDIKDIDWEKLDPRQYDPRRIVRDALLEPEPGPASKARPRPSSGRVTRTPAATSAAAAAGSASTAGSAPPPAEAATGSAAASASGPGAPAPYDDEAT